MNDDRMSDPKTVLTTMHHTATDELLRLLDGFYFNIEDGLFELAHNTDEQQQRRRCFDLMRELRFRKPTLIRHFAMTMNKFQGRWTQPVKRTKAARGSTTIAQDLDAIIGRMAEKSNEHFSGVLQSICERVAGATDTTKLEPRQMPISPSHIAEAFVMSCHSLKLDTASIEIVQELFSRFVLERLGSLYGECNARLETVEFDSADSDDPDLATGA